MSLSERWARLLEELRRQGRYRSLAVPAGLDFTSNDYLGYGSGARGPFAQRDGQNLALPKQIGPMGHIGPMVPASAENADFLPRSGMASRLLRGHHPLWEEVEAQLAAWHQSEAALVFSSGYLANVGLLSTIIEPEDWVASDALNHASLIDGLRLSSADRWIYPHNDLNQLETGLHAAAQNRAAQRELFIVTESLFSMEGDRAPLMELVAMAEKYGASLIVDEAHATGCIGPTGSGLVNAYGLRPRVLATVHTGGKALGVPGAYVCGSRRLREMLVNRSRPLIFSTALPLLVASWWLDMLPLVQADEGGRQLLHANARDFRNALNKHGITCPGQDYIVPVVVGPEQQATFAAEQLQEQGLDIRAIRPPTVPAGTSRLRLSVHADHERGTLERAARAVVDLVQHLRNES
jgi:8-amino-7-oxononanoate synthase